VSLTTIKRWMAAIPQRSAVRDLTGPAPESPIAAAVVERASVCESSRTKVPRSSRAHERTREWRRRALVRKGARLYSTIPWNGGFASLAMLDDNGMVLCWYERAADWDGAERSPINGHVSQLYTTEDAGLGIPMRELCRATTQEESIQTGWRLGIDGRKFWAKTTIRAQRLRDGRLQGFSHLICRLPTPWNIASAPRVARWKWPLTGAPRARFESAAAALAALLVLGTPTLAAAEAARVVPQNAKATEYGSGWECAHGYQRVRESCERIKVPANAYLDSSGSRWRCERGYVGNSRECMQVMLPANAYLDESFSAGWRCERRFRDVNGACVPIRIPAHAHEVDSSYGDGWACNHGYVSRAGACEEVKLPANAFLTRSGEEWKCDRGFTQTNGSCVAIKTPAHGYIDSQGNSWACERGFLKTASACEAIAVPANAHLDWSGDRWRCNRGFTAQAGVCTED
jgi:hypothetical protein